MNRRILLTAFEPFGGERLNPSWEVARHLDGRDLGRAIVKAVLLPVHCGRAAEAVTAAITELKPSAVLGLGQAAGRYGLSLEQVALNLAWQARRRRGKSAYAAAARRAIPLIQPDT